MHSLTQIKEGSLLRENTYSTAATWLACGIDINATAFYRQSDVPEVTELAWYLSCFFPYQRLTLAHSFKDKSDSFRCKLWAIYLSHANGCRYPFV